MRDLMQVLCPAVETAMPLVHGCTLLPADDVQHCNKQLASETKSQAQISKDRQAIPLHRSPAARWYHSDASQLSSERC